MIDHCLSKMKMPGGGGTPKSYRERFQNSSRGVDRTISYVEPPTVVGRRMMDRN